VDRFAAGPRCCRQLTGELDRSLVAVDVDHHPSRDQVLRFGERAVGHRRPPLAVVADPHAVGRQRLSVDELAAALEPSCEVVHEPDVCLDLVGPPLVHRDIVDGRRRASVVLEQQVLGHGVLLV